MKLSSRLALLGCLYFSQGLPFGFFTQALPVLMRKLGVSLGAIGLSSLLALPWALKFLWAPAVDRFWIARFGRRKSWIVPLQLASVAVLAALALGDPDSLRPLMAATLVLNLLAATQDIATDGLAVEMLGISERGLGNGLQVAGYRVGMIVGGGVLLILHDRLGSVGTFVAMALLTALATLPVAIAREPPRAEALHTGPRPRTHFLRRAGAARVLLLIVVYKAGDAFATGMLRPFLVDLGLSLTDVGVLLGTVGFVAGLFGALAGGALVNRFGRRPALLLFGALQAVAVASYAYLAAARPGPAVLYALCGWEHFAGGMATAALFTCMMDWCAPDSAATDYTVQASAVVIATGAASAVAGFSAQALGYVAHFALASVLAAAALLVVRATFPDAAVERSLRREHGPSDPGTAGEDGARGVAPCA
jgi:RhtX/FptX family siderophore transporter